MHTCTNAQTRATPEVRMYTYIHRNSRWDQSPHVAIICLALRRSAKIVPWENLIFCVVVARSYSFVIMRSWYYTRGESLGMTSKNNHSPLFFKLEPSFVFPVYCICTCTIKVSMFVIHTMSRWKVYYWLSDCAHLSGMISVVCMHRVYNKVCSMTCLSTTCTCM